MADIAQHQTAQSGAAGRGHTWLSSWTRRRRILLGLLVFNALSAVGGGIALMTGLIPAQLAWVQHTDFGSLYFPGVILMAVVGGSSLVAAAAMVKATPGWELASVLTGVIMIVWIVGEIASIRGFHILQVVYLVTGGAVVWYTPRPVSTQQVSTQG